jgi:hypothetical protein
MTDANSFKYRRWRYGKPCQEWKTLNNTEMIAGVEAPLSEGDKIAIDTFTIVRVNAIR